MQWILLVVGIAVAFFGVMAIFAIWNPLERNVGVDDFSEILHRSFFRHRNGGVTKFAHRGSDAWFSFERLEGDGNRAVAALRIPWVTWTRADDPDLNAIFGKHGFEVDTTVANESLIGHVLIPVEDIWDTASGARAAYAARLLMQATNIGMDQKFAVKEIGLPHSRYTENARTFR